MIIDLFNFKSNSSDLSLFRTNKQSSISRKLFFFYFFDESVI